MRFWLGFLLVLLTSVAPAHADYWVDVHYMIGPHGSSSHCPDPAAWDSLLATTAPDTCNRDNFASWSTYHWTPGHALTYHSPQKSTGAVPVLLPCHDVIYRYGWNAIEIAFCDSTDTPLWRSGKLGPR